MRRALPSLILGSLLTLVAVPAIAATMMANENLKVTAPIKDNAYLAGGQVTIDQPVNGDLLVAGGTVLVNSKVGQDILAAGGTLILEGSAQDLRAAGGNVLIRNAVQGDLIVAGGSVTIGSESTVNGDVFVAGGDVTIAGTVLGNVQVRGGNATIAGVLKGDADVRAESITVSGSIDGSSVLVAKKITIAPTAKIMKDVRYWMPTTEPALASPQIKGKVTLDPTLMSKMLEKNFSKKEATAGFAAAIVGIGGFLLLSAAFVILLLMLLTKNIFPETGRLLLKKPWTCLLYGFLFFAVTPIAAFLFLISIIGVPIGILIFVMYVFSIVFAKPLAALVLAESVSLSRKKEWGKVSVYLTAVLIYIVLKIVGLIPVIGWIVCTAAIFIAFGALMTIKWAKWQKIR
jgi:cytoskeletal protein CcmA (bactofilin family)